MATDSAAALKSTNAIDEERESCLVGVSVATIGGFDKLSKNIQWHPLSTQKLSGGEMPFAANLSLNKHTGAGLEADTVM